MPTLTATARTLQTVPADAVVLGVAAGASGAGPRLLGADDLPAELRGVLGASLAGLGVTGRPDEVRRVPTAGALGAPVLVLTGLGRVGAAGPDAEALRRAAGAAVRELAGTGSVALALPADDVDAAAAVAEGALLGAYAYRAYRRRSAAEHRAPVEQLLLVTPLHRERALEDRVERATVLAAAVAGARDLVNCPPADLYPASFADAVRERAKGLPVKVTVLDEQALAEGGYGGILGVGQGSSRPPRLVALSYAPRGAKAHLALVGKGITFDSGGLSIKPAGSMETMKCDMAGAAAVLEAALAVARLGLPVRVTAWMALAENMPSGTAQRPSDVLTTYGGRTVEVLNTDAEGRLVLADALVAAGEEQPDAVVDVATLTGAQVVALGTRVSAVMGEDDAFRERVLAAASRAGEQFWPMPLPEELRASMDSQVADIANMGDRMGGMLVAGLFLREFVPRTGGGSAPEDAPRLPWAHLDVAGPAFNEGAPHGYTGKGGTGVAVRTLVALAEDYVS
ncbi:leucyl aminopeptidase [Quadrisphaera sp. DSM 44207]|uniref:leucyl aminopeptidase n=1 Tax=Quadrisphaera sp. DSM 44207 TaxID=1881057 RepID=UPI000887F6C9|nr:leucyl aminopeptidase [Quadrisphaera sp. DSM 44207]SDQ32742.1 leucyl aminopeptidase [Quadrisphaera sp. DSM 44207]